MFEAELRKALGAGLKHLDPFDACEAMMRVAKDECKKFEAEHSGDVFYDANDNIVSKDDPRAVTAFFASTGHYEDVS